ncbi:MAG: hypothetical protein QXI12_01365 [Candidatus Methanomethyliaceae archaeon]
MFVTFEGKFHRACRGEQKSHITRVIGIGKRPVRRNGRQAEDKLAALEFGDLCKGFPGQSFEATEVILVEVAIRIAVGDLDHSSSS